MPHVVCAQDAKKTFLIDSQSKANTRTNKEEGFQANKRKKNMDGDSMMAGFHGRCDHAHKNRNRRKESTPTPTTNRKNKYTSGTPLRTHALRNDVNNDAHFFQEVKKGFRPNEQKKKVK